MPTDLSGAATVHDDMAVAELFARAGSVPPRDLAELASLIDRLEALITVAAGSESVGSDALERIADIAFVLHERDVEASLCDALDAGVRDLGDFGARTKANVDRMGQATELLSELSRRINSLIARSLAGRPAAGDSTPLESTPTGEPAGEEPAVAKMSNGGFEGRAIVAPVEPSLLLAGQAATASDTTRSGAADVVIERPRNRVVAEDEIDSDRNVGSPRAADDQADHELADPQDDPGDLFEPRTSPVAVPPDMSGVVVAPLPPTPPSNALAGAERGSIPADEKPPEPDHAARTSPSPPSSQPAAGPPQHAIGRQAPNDPLAAVRALSEEEMIALFS